MEGEERSNMRAVQQIFQPDGKEEKQGEWSLVQKSRFLMQSTERIMISTDGRKEQFEKKKNEF